MCVLTCKATVNLLAGAQTAKRGSFLIHLLAAAFVFGCGVWSLHFVAMLAFISTVPIAYGIPATFLSVLVAVVGALVAFSCWLFSPSRRIGVVVGGTLLGLSASAMHFCGVMAMQVSGTLHFDNIKVVASVAIGTAFAVMALGRSSALNTHLHRLEAAIWLMLGVCGLHFVAMTGLSIEPGLVDDQQSVVFGSVGLAVAIGSVSFAILFVSLAATLMKQHLSQRTVLELQRLRMLSDISQEVLVICRDGIILQVNAAGLRMFGTTEGQLVGTRMLDLVCQADQSQVAHCIEHDAIRSDPMEIHLNARNGTEIAAEFFNTAIQYEGKPAIVVALRDLSDRKRDEARIRHLAHHDGMTGLANRLLLHERLEHTLEAMRRSGGRLAVLCLDLDRFKAVNDLFGHATGDALLAEVAKRLQAEVRVSDTLARVGGDEFVIAAEFERPENVALLAGRLIDALSQPVMLDVGQVEIGLSIGIALFPDDAISQQELMRAADVALYRTKKEAGGSFRFFEPTMDEQLQARRQLERDLRSAIDNHQISLHYQPLVSAASGEVEGFEALIRWCHPTRGMIPPMEFIPLAEETGLITQLGKWVLETACRSAAAWQEPRWVAVNVSPIQFRKADLTTVITDILARTGLPADRLEIEITEGILMEEPKRAASVLSALRALGVRIAMDDFGTGYSSLSYLHEFKFDKLKIDRSFVTRLGQADDAEIIVRTIIGLAHNLGLSIVAEGVETVEQLKTLRDLMCDQIQGYLIGRPMQMDGSTELMAARAKALIGGTALAAYSPDREDSKYRTSSKHTNRLLE